MSAQINSENFKTATLLISCADRPGIVAKIANFIYSHGGNIIHADQHTDFSTGLFLNRVEWQLDGFTLSCQEIADSFNAIAKDWHGQWQIHFSDVIPRIAIWVTKQNHCLLDLLWRWQAGELKAEIPLIISNHSSLEAIASQFGIDFHHLPITKTNKLAQETQQLALLEKYQIDLVILAKYMQILSPNLVDNFPNIINIHHSFLPAFAGAKPYHRAYDRGVKIIGATAHYVTEDLDEGPIIEQEVVHVSHRDNVSDLIRKGKDLEKLVLSRAVRWHLDHRVLVYGNRTVVF
ncbi:formyltetrahydrofolate deformylase [Xenococcus sp. PCC 7305]|uniref:formyltetrahydrofolate deformylase n=1 Tax=Xenococcus sp. PCC 7305 TaxID=102125 RepID=UPI0002AC8C5A|nr:formyltetrahydrofolate deformylase [Xenococcus sp. PCC 7305]ELS00341.1 formyltetrahydrofolate deformylase [Xenococcus sp. PCC 7305]